MVVDELIQGLSESEKVVLLNIKKNSSLDSLVVDSNLSEIVVMRSLQWLANKNLVSLVKSDFSVFVLGKNGVNYKKSGLPERVFLNVLSKNKEISISELSNFISREEINACVGFLKKSGFIDVVKKGELFFSITSSGLVKLKNGFVEEDLLNKLPLVDSSLSVEDKSLIGVLLKRKDIIVKEKKSSWVINITALGSDVLKSDLFNKKFEERVTSDLIKSGKSFDFKKYDVTSSVPCVFVGRKHFVNEAKKYIKSIWLEMGFEEMSGDFVQPAFWNLDALFVPQDHPAREMQDTFYVEGSKSVDGVLLKKVKNIHETGGSTGSLGWGGSFSDDVSRELMLRTHTTVLSAIKFCELKREDLPKKFFVVSKAFRNEALDWKHLFEFHHVEGIVVDPDGDLPKLKGYLKEFFLKMGFSDVKIRPAHFPYTEPSAEVEAYNPVKKQWVEMGGAGIIRPEVSVALLGFECPVLAWGLGMERIISKYYDINDIRDLYRNDVNQLKNIKVFAK